MPFREEEVEAKVLDDWRFVFVEVCNDVVPPPPDGSPPTAIDAPVSQRQGVVPPGTSHLPLRLTTLSSGRQLFTPADAGLTTPRQVGATGGS